ncbi:MAG: HIT domain-containing protein [Patescibacteria group bacterium]
MQDCLFCKIAKGEIPAKKVAESDEVLAFYDIHPSADLHVLVVPKKHIVNFETIKPDDSGTILKMIELVQRVLKKENPSKYRIIINGGSFLEVQHLHWHLQGGSLTKHALKSLLNDN